MNSSLLRVLAVIFAIGALVVGYLGYLASRQPAKVEAPAPKKVEVAGEPVVFARRAISADQVISADDLLVGQAPMRPLRAYDDVHDLIGKKPKMLIPTGEMLLTTHFPSHSQLAQSVNPGERAVAIKVDEVIGTGGFLEPGDRVDVLLFLKADSREIGDDSSAQIILSDVRLLSFGNIVEEPLAPVVNEGPIGTDENPKDKNPSREAKKTSEKSTNEKPTGKSSKTAVLAVPVEHTTKLMLADSSGKLRLALHGVINEENQLGLMTGSTQTASLADKQMGRREDGFMELRELIGKKARSGTQDKSSETSGNSGLQAVVHKGSSTETIFLGR